MANNDFIDGWFSLESKVAVVTGGTGVLGGAMARGLAKAGAKVAIVGRRREKAEEVVREIREAGGTGFGALGDVMDKSEMERVRDAVLSEWGRYWVRTAIS